MWTVAEGCIVVGPDVLQLTHVVVVMVYKIFHVLNFILYLPTLKNTLDVFSQRELHVHF